MVSIIIVLLICTDLGNVGDPIQSLFVKPFNIYEQIVIIIISYNLLYIYVCVQIPYLTFEDKFEFKKKKKTFVVPTLL